MRKLGFDKKVIPLLLIFCALFNGAAWCSKEFADFYTDNIFPVITVPYGFFTSLFPFSVGEILLVVAVVLVLLSVLSGVVLLAYAIRAFAVRRAGHKRAPSSDGRNGSGFERVRFAIMAFFRGMAVLLSVVLTVMSLNCFVLYHCTPLRVAESEHTYTVAELAQLRDFIVEKCNYLATLMPRDEDGYVSYPGDMAKTAKQAMQGISDRYERLDYFYVTPKALTFSGFMSQQYMQGYYFPFSMEANYNDEMYIMNKPFTMCHELAHTHGYIYEDEANFLGFLSCTESDDIVFVYSGYLGVLSYVNNDFYRSVDRETYSSHVAILDQVREDDRFLTEDAWKRVEERAVLDTEAVKRAADAFIDTNLKVNGISDGKASYSHLVGLLLGYYYSQD